MTVNFVPDTPTANSPPFNNRTSPTPLKTIECNQKNQLLPIFVFKSSKPFFHWTKPKLLGLNQQLNEVLVLENLSPLVTPPVNQINPAIVNHFVSVPKPKPKNSVPNPSRNDKTVQGLRNCQEVLFVKNRIALLSVLRGSKNSSKPSEDLFQRG
uniref:Uncharacterized protein n=1 Tax=Cacopsylla melanoneura TaxID=428564 RepID=A0A8D8TMF7_9HEMI